MERVDFDDELRFTRTQQPPASLSHQKHPEVPENRHRSRELKADEGEMDPVAIVLLEHEWKSRDQAHSGE